MVKKTPMNVEPPSCVHIVSLSNAWESVLMSLSWSPAKGHHRRFFTWFNSIQIGCSRPTTDIHSMTKTFTRMRYFGSTVSLSNARHLWFWKLNYLLFLQFLPFIHWLNLCFWKYFFAFSVSYKNRCNRQNLPDNRIPQNMCPADNLETHLLTTVPKGGLLDKNFKEMRFLGS